MVNEKEFRKQIREAYHEGEKPKTWMYIAVLIVLLVVILLYADTYADTLGASGIKEIKTESDAAAAQQHISNVAERSSSGISRILQSIKTP